jgi:hypothetical protein
MTMAKVQVRKCDEGSAYAAALQRESDQGSGGCDDAAAMAGLLESTAQILLGPGVSPRLIWDGAQHFGLTNLELFRLIERDGPMAMDLMWVETDRPVPPEVVARVRAAAAR